MNDAASAEAAAKAAAACADNVDRYRAGKIMGRLSAKFFATELKPNVWLNHIIGIILLWFKSCKIIFYRS